MQQKQEALSRVQAHKQEEVKLRHNDNVIKQLDKRDNVERIMRVQDYEKEKLLEKINEKMTRADHIKAEREQLL